MKLQLETNKRICKICKKIKNRIQNGVFPGGKNKKWVDDDGRLWSGSICPDCQNEKMKKHQKAKYAKPETGN